MILDKYDLDTFIDKIKLNLIKLNELVCLISPAQIKDNGDIIDRPYHFHKSVFNNPDYLKSEYFNDISEIENNLKGLERIKKEDGVDDYIVLLCEKITDQIASMFVALKKHHLDYERSKNKNEVIKERSLESMLYSGSKENQAIARFERMIKKNQNEILEFERKLEIEENEYKYNSGAGEARQEAMQKKILNIMKKLGGLRKENSVFEERIANIKNFIRKR